MHKNIKTAKNIKIHFLNCDKNMKKHFTSMTVHTSKQ